MTHFCHDRMSNLQYANFLKSGVAGQDSRFPYVIFAMLRFVDYEA